MRRVMLLGPLALALPTAALASTITFLATSTSPDNSWHAVNAFPITALVVGPVYTFSLVTGPANFSKAGANPIFNLLGGTLTVLNTSTGALVFQNSLETRGVGISGGGQILPNNEIQIAGSLEPNAIKAGTFFLTSINGGMGTSFVVVTTTDPEPSALEGLLLGFGILGLAEMTRRKLRLKTYWSMHR